ncbi:methyltransferase domain-containing protein [Candidatus Woesearchaeota archaeon]|nr:MAG: methyltransferase domain-containing protein [Candidatus Woesearchaeota archaeon]
MDVFDQYSAKEAHKLLEQFVSFIKKGYHKEKIKQVLDLRIGNTALAELYSMARARINAKNKQLPHLFFNLDDLRFCTHQLVAEYRAKQVKGNVVDLCSGVGIQALAFAKQAKHVLAIEVDPRKVSYAKKNAELLNIKNITFLEGNVLAAEIIQQVKEFHPDVVFCDPERLPEEKERAVENIQPDLHALVKKYGFCKNIMIELPPQIKKIPFEGEKEYISISHELNRLTVYLNRENKNSVVLLPTEEKISGLPEKKQFEKAETPLQYLYEIDPAVIKAELDLLKNEKCIFFYEHLITSNEFIKNNFLTAYSVIFFSKSKSEIIEKLKELNAGSVIIKGKVDEKEYWTIRNNFEKELTGNKTFYLFLQEYYCVAEKLLLP